MYTALQFHGTINSTVRTIPSGVVPMKTRARKSWVNNIPEDCYRRIHALDRDIRFGLYQELDEDVLGIFVKLCRAADGRCDTDELMIEAGRMAAAELMTTI